MDLITVLVIVWATGAVCTAMALASSLVVGGIRNPRVRITTSPARVVWLSLTWPPRVLWAFLKHVFEGV